MNRNTVFVLGCLVIAIGVFAFAAMLVAGGVEVVVRNVGTSPIENVFVHVTGNDYALGTIDVESDAHIKVEPKGESHLEISFVDSNGLRQRLVVDCYFEPRLYTGTITVDNNDESLIRVEDTVSIGFY